MGLLRTVVASMKASRSYGRGVRLHRDGQRVDAFDEIKRAFQLVADPKVDGRNPLAQSMLMVASRHLMELAAEGGEAPQVSDAQHALDLAWRVVDETYRDRIPIPEAISDWRSWAKPRVKL